MSTPQALAASPKTFLDRDNWMRAVNASDLPDAAVRVAIAIALHLRVNTGRCNPSCPTLAVESHVSERSTYRLIDLLEHRGWIAITRATGCLNQYTLLTPAKPMAVVTTPAKPMAGVPLPNRAGTTAKNRGDHCQQAGSQKDGTTKRTTKGKKRALRARTRPPNLVLGKEGVADEESKKELGPEKAPPKIDLADGFARFMSVYPRKINEDDARAAFDKAIGAGADIETVVARAAVYAVERADAIRNGDLPKWTLYPATWLKKRKYNDPLPPGTIIDNETGAIVAIEQPQQARPARGFEAVADELIRNHVVNEKTGW